MRIAIPVVQERVAENFEDFNQFALIDILNQEVKQRQFVVPPPMEPWMFVHWCQEHDVNVIIAGNIKEKIVSFFEKAGIKVIIGAPLLSPEKVVQKYLSDTLFRGQVTTQVHG